MQQNRYFFEQIQTFRNPKMLINGIDVDLLYTLNIVPLHIAEVEKCLFSSLQNILNCHKEIPLKTDVSVKKFNECLIELLCPIAKFCSQN